MSFRSFFPIRRNLYQRLFSQDVENRHSIDEIIVHPAQRTYDSSTSSNSNFHKIENLIDFFETPYSKSLLKDTRKISIQKFETLRKPSATELEELSQKCLENSIVILLAMEGRTEFHLYWKSKQIKFFLTLKINDRADFLNDINLFEFLADFLANSIARGHLGLYSKVPIRPSVNKIRFDLLADQRDYNLLLIAADVGDAHVVKLMLELGLSTDFQNINAQTLAWNNRHFEVLSLLLKSNLIYPYSIYIDECPEDIQEFFEVSRELNEAISARDEDKVLRIITHNKDMTHFYNLNNNSALTFALNRRLFDMYRLLISKNIMFGPHENFSEIKEDMTQFELIKLQEIHFKESKTLPDNHMHVLMSNSRLGHDSINVQEKFQKIQNAFEILNGNPFIQILLKIIAASRNFRIIFDFNRDSIGFIDPTEDDSTDGLFYLSGRIYIAAKKLLDNKMKFEALGVLAHELCHYTMVLVYKNIANPYFANDSKTKKLFEEICNFCAENAGKEKLIDIVYKCYIASVFHAELIVRVPHLIMVYLNNPEKFNAVRSNFHKLFDFYEEKVFKEMKEALPKIEAKAEAEKEKNQKKLRRLKKIYCSILCLFVLLAISGISATILYFYKPTYKFSEMSREDQIKVENAPVIYNHVDIAFHDLFPKDAPAYNALTSDDISQMLKNIPLNISDRYHLYLKDLIIFEWNNMTIKLKDKLLTSNFTFQNESITFKMLNISDDAYKSLESKLIIKILDGKPFFVHKMISNNSAFYTERIMFTDYIYPIYFLFMNKLNGDKIQLDCIYKNTSGTVNDTFIRFYRDFEMLPFKEIIRKTNQITNNDYYSTCFVSGFEILDPKTREVVDTLLSCKSLQKDYDEILEISGIKPKAKTSRLFILSADAGTGKTVTFVQYALRIKRMYPTRWVSYIDYRQHNKCPNETIETIDDAKKALAEMLMITSKRPFEYIAFEEFFKSGRMILLWDGYDQICPKWLDSAKSPASKIIELIQNNSTNIQFVSSRPSYSEKLRTTFSIEPYTFVPLNNASKKEFLRGFFNSQNFNGSEIIKHIAKVEKIVKSTKSKNDFNTPLPLQMIALIISTDKNIYESENLYQIYHKVVENKLLVWLNSTNGVSKLIESLLMHGIGINDIFQKYALRIIPDTNIRSFNRYLSLKLEITTIVFPRNIKINQISEMGILYIKNKKSYSFAHSTFIEFFIAQYIIQHVFNARDEVYDLEAEKRIQLFFWSIQDTGISIFIESYLKTVNTKDDLYIFNPQILKPLQTKYSNFMLNMLHSPTAPIPLLMEFFMKNHTLLIQQLQINQSRSIYPSTYDYAYFNFFSHDAINRSAILDTANKNLTKDEYKQFILLKDRKGIILYSMYCVKQFHNSSEYARNSTPGYDLPDEIFNNDNVSEVLMSIAQNLTSKELKKLLTSRTVWFRLYIYNGMDYKIQDNNFEFYKTLLDLIETNLSINEQKNWFFKIFKFPFLLKDQETRDFLLNKFSELQLNHAIYDRFSTLNVLHYAATIGNTGRTHHSARFNYTWNFFKLHSNRTHQKLILKRLGYVECYLDRTFRKFCYLVPEVYLLQASLLDNLGCTGCNSTQFFQEMVSIYRDYFNDNELQDLIVTGSTDFIPFLIIVRSLEDCKAYAEFLKGLFKGKELSLKNFLLKPVQPTMLNVFRLFVNLHYSEEKVEVFKKIINL